MKNLLLNKKTLDKYSEEFKKGKNLEFIYGYECAYGYKWTEKWADKKLFDNKSFKEHLIWNGRSLWYFYEYFIRDNYYYDLLPFSPFPVSIFKIDLYNWIISREKPKNIVAKELDYLDVQILKEVCKRSNVSLKKEGLIQIKGKLRENKFLVKNFIITRLFLRWIISRLHRKDFSKNEILIFTNDRHSSEKLEGDAFFGSVIKELKKERIRFKAIEYDRPYSPDNLLNVFRKYFLKRTSLSFIGDYYNIGTLIKTLKTGAEFRKLGRNIINRKEFKNSLTYKGINFHPFVNERLEYLFDVLSYYIADVLIITRKILERERPSAVLLEHEKNYYDKGIIVNSRLINKKGGKIKTFCFEGEQVYDKNSYLRSTKTKEINNPESPLWRPLADVKFLWGDYSKNWFIKNAHYPKKMLKVVGFQKGDLIMANLKNLNKNSLFAKYGLKNKKTVLVITGTISWEKKLIYESVRALKGLGVQTIFKLHPDDDLQISKYILDCCSKLGLDMPLILKYANFNELLAISDLVLTYESTLGYDVLVSGKPMIVLNFSDEELYLPYSKEKLAPVVTDSKVLESVVKGQLFKKSGSSSRNTKRFIYHHLYKLDGEASVRIVKVIRRLIKKKVNC